MADFQHDTSIVLRLPLTNPIVNAPAALYEHAIARGEAMLAARGQLVADTGKFTGRSPRDKYVVRDALERGDGRLGPGEPAARPEAFQRLQEDMFDAAAEKQLFVQDLYVGSDPPTRSRCAS
jgi:phosphoenolpyruvate carboxykinase (ATP)